MLRDPSASTTSVADCFSVLVYTRVGRNIARMTSTTATTRIATSVLRLGPAVLARDGPSVSSPKSTSAAPDTSR